MASKKKVLIGCTGSVATIKLPVLVQKLQQRNVDVRVVVTEKAKHFLKEQEMPQGCQVLSDTVEWAAWQGRGDPVLHIDLAKWADMFLIAPLDANTLGKLASGICDNILTCVARAWDPVKPLLFCPSMNTKMWEHPVTAPQVALLKSWGYKEVPCISKTLMCGDTGMGGMAEVDSIVQATLRHLNQERDRDIHREHDAHREIHREHDVHRDGLRDGLREHDVHRDGLRDGLRDALRDGLRDGHRDIHRDGHREVHREVHRDCHRDRDRDLTPHWDPYTDGYTHTRMSRAHTPHDPRR